MTTVIPFVPTPRLAYTEKYNRRQEDMRLDMLEQKRNLEILQDQRLEEYREAKKLEEKRKMDELLKDMNLYNRHGKTDDYLDYKYAYYVGTLIDKYI